MRTLTFSRTFQVTPGLFIRAFTDFELLKDWWKVDKVFIEKKVGGIYTLSWMVREKEQCPDAFAYVSTGIITSYDPNRFLKIEKMVYLNPDQPILGPMSLSIAVSENEQGCEVQLIQDGYQEGEVWDWYYKAVKTAWPHAFDSLDEMFLRISS